MNTLDIAIQAEGSVTKLAATIGVKPNVISNWRKRKVPAGWGELLKTKYKKQVKQANAEKAAA